MFNLNNYTVVERDGYIETQVDNIDDLIELIRTDKFNCNNLMIEEITQIDDQHPNDFCLYKIYFVLMISLFISKQNNKENRHKMPALQ